MVHFIQESRTNTKSLQFTVDLMVCGCQPESINVSFTKKTANFLKRMSDPCRPAVPMFLGDTCEVQNTTESASVNKA